MTGIDTSDGAVDAEMISRILRRCGAMDSGQQIVSVELTSLKVGWRATYRVDLVGPEDQLVVKCFDEHERASTAASAMAAIAAALAPPSFDRVIEPIGCVDDGVLVYRRVGGLRLDDLIFEGSEALAGELAARWLAHLHSSQVRLQRTLDPSSEWRTIESWLATLTTSSSVPRSMLDGVRSRLSMRCPSLPAVLVPIHKDFHHGHLFVESESSVSAIDLDEARLGPPDLDLAHFVAGLDVLALLRGSVRPAATAETFLAHYTAATGWRSGPEYRWWRSYSLVKLAWQATQGVGPPPMPEHTDGNQPDLARPILDLALSGGIS